MSGIYGARLAQKSSRISREESARAATGDVDERASRAPSSKREKTRRERKDERKKKRETEGGKRTKEERRRDEAVREGAREREASRV